MSFSSDRIAMWSSPTHVNTSKNCLWWLRGIKVMVYGRSEAMETAQRESGKQAQSGQNQHGRQERHVMAPEPRQQAHVNVCLCASEENRSELFSIAPPLHINILWVQKYSRLLSKNTDQGMILYIFFKHTNPSAVFKWSYFDSCCQILALVLLLVAWNLWSTSPTGSGISLQGLQVLCSELQFVKVLRLWRFPLHRIGNEEHAIERVRQSWSKVTARFKS